MIPFEQLCGWALGELSTEEAESVEEHVFECDECARAATFLTELGPRVTGIARAGRVRFALTRALAEHIAADQLPVRQYEINPGDTVPCQATSDQAYAITRLNVDLADVDRVHMAILAPDGSVIDEIDDAPFDAQEQAVWLAETGDAVRALPTMVIRIRLTGHSHRGTSRELGVFGLSHTGLGGR